MIKHIETDFFKFIKTIPNNQKEEMIKELGLDNILISYCPDPVKVTESEYNKILDLAPALFNTNNNAAISKFPISNSGVHTLQDDVDDTDFLVLNKTESKNRPDMAYLFIDNMIPTNSAHIFVNDGTGKQNYSSMRTMIDNIGKRKDPTYTILGVRSGYKIIAKDQSNPILLPFQIAYDISNKNGKTHITVRPVTIVKEEFKLDRPKEINKAISLEGNIKSFYKR